MLYSTTDYVDIGQAMDANTYPPFKAVDTSVTQKIRDEIDALDGVDEEGQPRPFLLRPQAEPMRRQRPVHSLAR